MNDEFIKFDGNDYEIIDAIDIDNYSYAYLVNINNPKDFFVRRINDENDSLDPVETKEEYARAIDEFSKKHKDEIENIDLES